MTDRLKNITRTLLYGVLMTYCIHAYTKWDIGWFLDVPNYSPGERVILLLSTILFCFTAGLGQFLMEEF